MSDYINWHKEKSASTLHHDYTIAHQILEDNIYDFQTIQQRKGVENQGVWKNLEIKPGIKIRFARNVSKWAKQILLIKMERSSIKPEPQSQHQPNCNDRHSRFNPITVEESDGDQNNDMSTSEDSNKEDEGERENEQDEIDSSSSDLTEIFSSA